MEVKAYPHPNYPKVTLWDLPGIGTPKFPANRYLELVEFEKFDFFIIISDTRFRENDVKLAQKIRRMGKKLYFVHSKIDHNLQDEERSQGNFNAEETVARIKENCIQGLQKQGVESPQVFLLSSFDLHLHDFPLLHETLEKELPAHKRDVLLFAMPNISLEIIKKKREAFQSKIHFHAIQSAAGAVVPVPGFSVALDAGLMAKVTTEYRDGFGLDKESLQRLSDSTGVPLKDLMAVIKSPLALLPINFGLILRMLTQYTAINILTTTGKVAKFIPILGTMVAVTLSFLVTEKALNTFLDMLAEDAQRVFKKALGLDTSV